MPSTCLLVKINNMQLKLITSCLSVKTYSVSKSPSEIKCLFYNSLSTRKSSHLLGFLNTFSIIWPHAIKLDMVYVTQI